jgi:cob(I)alamin adenosyltransferase
MGHRLSKIATRTGDDGTTGLGDGSRVRKNALRIVALGDVDELNSALGVMLTESMPETIRANLTQIQNDLFDLGGEVSIPGYRLVKEEQVAQLDDWLAHYNADLPPLKEFILPGGSKAAAHCHVARATCRRAERSVVALGETEDVSASVLQYLNRLSDLLFVLARVLNRSAQHPDTLWRRQP